MISPFGPPIESILAYFSVKDKGFREIFDFLLTIRRAFGIVDKKIGGTEMNWSRSGQQDEVFSKAKAEAVRAEAEAKAARDRDMKAAKELKKAEKAKQKLDKKSK